eukprot:scaffold68547_cov87-Phaeocystis_antarctica.AAC.1
MHHGGAPGAARGGAQDGDHCDARGLRQGGGHLRRHPRPPHRQPARLVSQQGGGDEDTGEDTRRARGVDAARGVGRRQPSHRRPRAGDPDREAKAAAQGARLLGPGGGQGAARAVRHGCGQSRARIAH